MNNSVFVCWSGITVVVVRVCVSNDFLIAQYLQGISCLFPWMLYQSVTKNETLRFTVWCARWPVCWMGKNRKHICGGRSWHGIRGVFAPGIPILSSVLFLHWLVFSSEENIHPERIVPKEWHLTVSPKLFAKREKCFYPNGVFTEIKRKPLVEDKMIEKESVTSSDKENPVANVKSTAHALSTYLQENGHNQLALQYCLDALGCVIPHINCQDIGIEQPGCDVSVHFCAPSYTITG